MPLDRIVCINLERSPERNKAFIEHMSQVDGAMDILERFNAHDGRDYDSQEAVIDAAIADGLDFYKVFKAPQFAWVGRGTLACFWSYFSILCTAIERGETTLVLYDDRPLVKPDPYWKPPRTLSELNEILLILEAEPIPFLSLQLSWNTKEDPEITESQRPAITKCPDITQNFSGCGDSHNIYSPSGAQWLIDQFKREPHNLEEVTNRLSKERHPGTYGTKYSDNGWGWFLHHDVQDRLAIDALDPHIPVPEEYQIEHPVSEEVSEIEVNNVPINESTGVPMIEKVFVIALEDDKTEIFRFGMAVGSLCVQRTPQDRIELFPASDGRHGGTKRIAQEAVSDGFTAFEKFFEDPIAHIQMAINWSWFRVLRQIQDEIQSSAMVLLSDCTLQMDFYDLEDVVGKVAHYNGKDLAAIQLSRWTPGAEQFIRPVPIEPGSRITEHLAYGDHGTIFTPVGAQLFLNFHNTPEWVGWTPEMVIKKIPTDTYGIYSVCPEAVGHEYYKSQWSDRRFDG